MNKILLVIPARGGSKGILRKNIYSLNGKPLISYVIEQALSVRDNFYGIIVSTDDEEIADIAKSYGAEVPFLRPKNLSKDNTPSLPVMQHAARYIENRDRVTLDWTMLVPPTSPLIVGEDLINAALKCTQHTPKPTSLVSIVEEVEAHPVKIKVIDKDGYVKPFLNDAPNTIRRQDLKPRVFRRNCCIYMTRRDILLNHNDLYGSDVIGYEMPEERSVDINQIFDIKLAETLLREKQ